MSNREIEYICSDIDEILKDYDIIKNHCSRLPSVSYREIMESMSFHLYQIQVLIKTQEEDSWLSLSKVESLFDMASVIHEDGYDIICGYVMHSDVDGAWYRLKPAQFKDRRNVLEVVLSSIYRESLRLD